jgi:hypothetical protein
MEKQFFGLTTTDVKRIAFQLAIKNDIPHPFSGKDKKAGWKWFHNFMHLHPQPSLRKPEPTSAARAKGFTPENVLKFFYGPLLEKVQLYPHRL